MSNKRQRPSDLEIDEKTLEYVKKQPAREQQEDPKSIAQRKIYKIKGVSEDNPTPSKAKFTLFDTPKEKKQETNSSVGADAKPTPNPQQAEGQKKSLFGNGLSSGIFGNGVGLFSGSTASTGLFSNTNNIFAKKPAENTGSTSGLGFFGSSNNSQSIFKFNQNGAPPIKRSEGAQGDDNEEGDSAELEKQQNKEIDPTKSSGKYEYKTTAKIEFQAPAVKLKKHNGEIVQNVEVVIQSDEAKKLNWVIVRLPATKNAIVSGLLIKGKSEVKHLGSKTENVMVSALVVKDKISEKQVLKIQFQSPEDGSKFKQTVEGMINPA